MLLRSLLALTSAPSLLLATSAAAAPDIRIVYVDADATGAGDGSSWQDAFPRLSTALGQLQVDFESDDVEVWVAEGSYRPTDSPVFSHLPSFLLTRQMKLFGGFSGTETARNQRDPAAHPTTLTGETGEPGIADNSNHVLSVLTFQPTLIDGFTIRDGNAFGPTQGGSALLVLGASAVHVHACTFVSNRSSLPGGAVRLTDGSAKATFSDCLFVDNHALAGGGAAVHSARPIEIYQSTFAGNSSSTTNGAAIVIDGQANGSLIDACLLFANPGPSGVTFGSEIQANATTLLSRSHVESLGSSTAKLGVENCSFAASSGGVINARGADGLFGTADDDFTPDACGTLVDQIGGAGAVDVADIDGDGSVTDLMPFDLRHGARAVDLPAPNDRNAFRDIGAIERPLDPRPSPDISGDGIVDAADLALLLGGWNPSINCSSADLDADGDVDGGDLAILLGAWTA